MSGISLEQAKAMLDIYVTAEQRVLKGQAYQLNGQAVTMANLEEIRRGRQEWEATVERLSSGSRGPRAYRAIPRDL